MTKPIHSAALLALALGWPLAHAQAPAKPATPPATKSLGDAKPGGKLLTLEELRACLGTQKRLAEERPALERERAELDREMDELQRSGEALKSEREDQERSRAEAVSAFNAKQAAHAERIERFNARMQAFNEPADKRDRRFNPVRERAELEQERAALTSAQEALKVEAETVNRMSVDAATAFNARVAARDRQAESWNERNRALVSRTETWQDENSQWRADCAGRRYREDDEIAIQRGR